MNIRPRCPKCNGDDVRALDWCVVIQSPECWFVHEGQLRIQGMSEYEVDWDSAKTYERGPLVCHKCGAYLQYSELIITDEGRATLVKERLTE